MSRPFRKLDLAACVLSATLALAAPALAADLPEACNSYTAAVTGGPMRRRTPRRW